MRFRCVLLAALALMIPTFGTQAAEEAAFLAAEAAGAPDAGCVLVDVEAESPEGMSDAIRAAGFMPTPTPAQLPQCPTAFACTSIANCGSGLLCSIQDIGACCRVTPVLARCCITGTIKVVRCPCQCTATICASSCVQSNNVSSFCS
jgi:hypothetical protein